MVASQDNPEAGTPGREMCKRRVADAETRLRRLQEAIASGVDPVALVDVINEAQRERAAARGELERAPVPNLLTGAEVYAMIDSLGNVGAALSEAKRDSLANLYTGINLQVLYEPREKAADVSVRLGRRVNSAGVRGGSCALTTRLGIDRTR
ncbi:hypothetical protein ACTXG6_37270 [Pseudonocardia sp. Cha107L01]|uniref:hypothetical protein n=1 Tax=Pseudonocardia sp. Cha107L01 TaxID=3457576 RepID=UPI00403EAA70